MFVVSYRHLERRLGKAGRDGWGLGSLPTSPFIPALRIRPPVRYGWRAQLRELHG